MKKNLKKTLKNFQKPLDKVKKMWYNIEVAAKNGNDPVQGLEKEVKKLEKSFKKPLDKQKRLWYNRQALAQERAIEP